MKQRTLDEILLNEIFIGVCGKCHHCNKEIGLKGFNIWFKQEQINNIKQQIKAWCYGKLAVKKKDCIDMSWEDGFNQCHDESRERIEKGK